MSVFKRIALERSVSLEKREQNFEITQNKVDSLSKKKKRKKRGVPSLAIDVCPRELNAAGKRRDEARGMKSPSLTFEQECWCADQILKGKDRNEE